MTEPAFTNRLVHEKSPYLLQHAHNPVDWYPWGEEAFEAARKSGKPIFLSIGYATCHWCHVMEKESFSNAEIAKLLNETFINVKVDREELPQVDAIYMEFAQALTGSAAGWPLNLVLEGDLKPLFAVTYLPPKPRRGLLGFDQFILNFDKAWKGEEKTLLIDQSEKMLELFAQMANPTGEAMPGAEDLLRGAQAIFELVDPIYGGIKGEPKFPLGYQANFLLAFTKLHKESRALFCVELSLDKMAQGGIYDHLGGGFSRYTVDERWRIPHFEKMLYDNAILASAYLAAWKYTKKERYKEICKETIGYVLGVLADPQGGFYSGEDADTEGREGLFYTWTAKEIREAIPPQDQKLFCSFYGVTEEGQLEGRNILYCEEGLEEFAEDKGTTVEQIKEVLARCKSALLKIREQRPRLFKDDKLIASWNGLMIDALVQAGRAFGEEKWVAQAVAAAERIKKEMWREKHLLRRFREGDARYPAGLEDYAYMIKGLLSLFEAGCGAEYCSWAIEMADLLEREFKAEGGAFYSTREVDSILIRRCEFYDGAEPSANAVHAENLLRLYQITQVESYLEQAEDILKGAKNHVDLFPPGACYHLIALQRLLDTKGGLIIIVLDENNGGEAEIRAALNTHFCPHFSIVWKRKNDLLLPKILPMLQDKGIVDGQTTFYLCRQDVCEPPLNKREEILKAIEAL